MKKILKPFKLTAASLKFILLSIFAAKITIGSQVRGSSSKTNEFGQPARRFSELNRNRGEIAAVQRQLLSKLEEASKLQDQLYKIVGPLDNRYYRTIREVGDPTILQPNLRAHRSIYDGFPTLDLPIFRPSTTSNDNSKRSESYVPPVGPIQNPNFETRTVNINGGGGDGNNIFPANQQQEPQQLSGFFYRTSWLIPPAPKMIQPLRTPATRTLPDYSQNYASFPESIDESSPQLFVNASFQNVVPRIGSQQPLFIPGPPRPETIPGSQSLRTLSPPQRFSAEEEFSNFSRRSQQLERKAATTDSRRPREDLDIFPTIVDVDDTSITNPNSIPVEGPEGLVPPPVPIRFDGSEFETSLLPRIEDSEKNFQIIESLWTAGNQEEKEKVVVSEPFLQPPPLFVAPALSSARTQQQTTSDPTILPIRRQKIRKNKSSFRLPYPSDYEDDPFESIQLGRPPASPPLRSLRLFSPTKPYITRTTQPPPYPYPTGRLPFDVDKAPTNKPRRLQSRRRRQYRGYGSRSLSSANRHGSSFLLTTTNEEEPSNPSSHVSVERRQQFYPSTQPPLLSSLASFINSNPITIIQRRRHFNIQSPPTPVAIPRLTYRRYGDSNRPPPKLIQYPIVPKTSIVQPTWTSTTGLDHQQASPASSSSNHLWQLVERPPSPPVYSNSFQWQTYKPPRTGKAGGNGWSNAIFYGPISISGVPVKGNSNQEKVCVTVKIPTKTLRTDRSNPIIPVAKPRICCKVKGFSRESKRERWFAIGCDVEGTAGCVPWETRYAYPALRCRSNVAKRFAWTHSPTLEALPIEFKGVVY